jgi:hypothetical protein
MTALSRYDTACLAAETRLPEVMKLWRAATNDRVTLEAAGDRARAIDAAEFELRCERRIGEIIIKRREAKAAWIAAARLEFAPDKRQPCIVCGKFRHVAHAHHAEPLAAQYDRGAERASHAHVWLCPTHHAILHVLIDRNPETDEEVRAHGRAAAGAIEDVSEKELQALFDLMPLSRGGTA